MVGKFETVTYRVIYQFYDTILPPNAEDYLPETKKYMPGSTVRLEDIVGEPSNYSFLGWYKEHSFEMPNQDVIIYGEWKRVLGTFAPTITKEVLNRKDDYKMGDEVELKIIVTNTADFPLKNVMIQELQETSSFIDGTGYTILSNHIANIDELDAYESIELFAKHIVTFEEVGTVESDSQIVGGSADNGYSLEDGSYVATTTFHVLPKLKICNEVVNTSEEKEVEFKITGNNHSFDTSIVLGNGQCEMFTLDPATYHINEIIPDGYTLEVRGAITKNNSNFVVKNGHNYEIIFTNKTLQFIFVPDTLKNTSSIVVIVGLLMISGGV